MEFFPCFLFIVFAIFIVGVSIVVTQNQLKKTNAAWQAVAKKFRFHHEPGALFTHPRIMGELREQSVLVETYARKSGKNSTTYTRFRVSFPESLGMGLNLSKSGFFTGLWTMMGGQDIKTGDANFDERVVVRGRNVATVVSYLHSSRRRLLLRVFDDFPEILVTDHSLEWNVRGVKNNPKMMSSTIRKLVSAACKLNLVEPANLEFVDDVEDEEAVEVIPVKPIHSLDLRQPTNQPIIRPIGAGAMERPLQGSDQRYRDDILTAAIPPILTPQPVSENVLPEEDSGDEPIIEDEYEAGIPTELESTSDSAANFSEPSLSDPESGEPAYNAQFEENIEELASSETAQEEFFDMSSTEGIESLELEMSPAVPSAKDDQATPSPVNTLDKSVNEIAQYLFGGSLISFQVDDAYKAEFDQKQVEGTGILEQVSSYLFDMTFGDEPGTKATVTVFEPETEFSSWNKVVAVLQLPANCEDELTQRRGQEIRFSGTLVKCDSFQKQLLLQNAKILS